MSRLGISAWPLIRSDFKGVDWTTDPEKIALGALQECVGFRITREGNLKNVPGLNVQNYEFGTVTIDRTLGGHWDPHGDLEDGGEIVAFAYEGTDIRVSDDIPLDLGGAVDSLGIGVLSADERLVTSVLFNEILYICYAGNSEGVLKWTGSSLGAIEADLDDDGDATDDLLFLSIGKYGEHVMGHGFGDEQGTGSNETTDLGPDRPEIVRWSNLGAAGTDQWRPEAWIMVGTRGLPVMRGHEAFGSYACMKPEGVWLLYGDLENNLPQLESLLGESGESPGSVAPNASCVYNGILYWLSPKGPMRWTGGARAEYLGLPTEDSLLPSAMSSVAWVLPEPELDVVLFALPETTDGPVLPGGVPGPGSTGTTDVWMWDPRRERWVGRIAFADLYQNAFIAPRSNGVRRLVLCGNEADLAEFSGDGDSNVNISSSQWTTGEIELDEGRPAIYRGLILSGDFTALSAGIFRVQIQADGANTRLSAASLYIQTGTPSAGNKGNVWYNPATAELWVSDGSSWIAQRGFREGQIRMPHPAQRAARIRVAVSAQSITSMDQTFEWFGLQVDRG